MRTANKTVTSFEANKMFQDIFVSTLATITALKIK